MCIRDRVRILQNIDFPSIEPSLTLEKEETIEQGVSDIKTDYGTPPSGGPPPPPGSGGPPPPPG